MANEDIIKRKGITITLRDNKEYKVLPLPIDDLIEIWPLVVKLENKEEKVDVALLQDIKKLVYTALKSANEVKEEEVGKIVDLEDLQAIIKVIVGQKTDIAS